MASHPEARTALHDNNKSCVCFRMPKRNNMSPGGWALSCTLHCTNTVGAVCRNATCSATRWHKYAGMCATPNPYGEMTTCITCKHVCTALRAWLCMPGQHDGVAYGFLAPIQGLHRLQSSLRCHNLWGLPAGLQVCTLTLHWQAVSIATQAPLVQAKRSSSLHLASSKILHTGCQPTANQVQKSTWYFTSRPPTVE